MIRQEYSILESIDAANQHAESHEEEEQSIIDKIVTICCALYSCCPSVVSCE